MANFNLNKVIIGGRLTADPELKMTPSNVPVTSFTVAVNRRYSGKSEGDQQADFINVTAWRTNAEFITKYFRKGSSICIIGSIQTRSWTDQEGKRRYATDVIADEITFVDSKSESQQGPQGGYVPDGYGSLSQNAAPGVYQNPSAPKFDEMTDDDELPF